MKRIIALFLTLIMCLSFVGCVTKNETTTNTETTIAETTIAETTIAEATVNTESMSDDEKFVAEFCMACMDFLKNPYSFELKKAWIDMPILKRYEISITYTSENSVGGTVTGSFSTSTPIKSADVAKIDSILRDVYLEEFAIDTSSKGEYLDVEKIQNYINENYK